MRRDGSFAGVGGAFCRAFCGLGRKCGRAVLRADGEVGEAVEPHDVSVCGGAVLSGLEVAPGDCDDVDEEVGEVSVAEHVAPEEAVPYGEGVPVRVVYGFDLPDEVPAVAVGLPAVAEVFVEDEADAQLVVDEEEERVVVPAEA